ncbi:MAG: double-strand break repair protein AddB, partial [Pseudolabrys sp.]|nr:double-strand break repair protein AddB [Pseudolabrys sp.]
PSLAAVFDDIIENGTLRVTVNDYAELFHAALASTAARTPHSDARVRILGTLESRLQYADRVVLGGLAEGVWPPETGSDAWLSRPMRLELGLDLPERRIGLSAHDFAQALGNPDIVLSAASRVGGAPTVPSRFVQRLAAVAGQERWNKARKSGEKYLTWARALDRPVRSAPIAMPAPKPPAEARPTQISVTDIENWLRDPYTIYAKHILKLFPLEAIDMPPGGRDRGNIIHGAIADFAQSYPAEMPADAISLLQNFGEKRFAGYEDFPEVKAFWWPRFLRVARWLTEEFEARRRPGINTLYTECYGKLPIPLGGSTFTLTGRADRIERLADGSFAILDFKTGAPPTDPQVRTFLSPQLTLEAAMLRNGAFKEIGKGGSVSQLVYVALGGGEPPGKDRIIDLKDSTPDSHADIALTRLAGLVTRFSDPETPYRPLAHPMWKTHYGDYDHLARVKEWSIGSDSENGE